MRASLAFSYDPDKDELTIEGVRYSGELFRQYGIGPSPADRWHRIVERREDGQLVIEQCIDVTRLPLPIARQDDQTKPVRIHLRPARRAVRKGETSADVD